MNLAPIFPTINRSLISFLPRNGFSIVHQFFNTFSESQPSKYSMFNHITQIHRKNFTQAYAERSTESNPLKTAISPDTIHHSLFVYSRYRGIVGQLSNWISRRRTWEPPAAFRPSIRRIPWPERLLTTRRRQPDSGCV